MLNASERFARILPGRLGAAALTMFGVLVASAGAHASEAIELPGFDQLDMMWPAVFIVFICAVIGLLFGAMWFRAIMKEDPGSKGMINVSKAVQEGAMAYLKRQIATMIWFVIIIAAGLIFLYKPLPGFSALDIRFHVIPVYIGVGIAFVLGVFASYLAGLVGMMMAVRANVRAANAALSSFKHALDV
ncbi:MAG: sodium/proton-translocating pyrophosphatase, partial [Armatimonadetes bacterium]|nr:sodium/proton-translocating pyrophosphatase [Armatimonadota bacterium]